MTQTRFYILTLIPFTFRVLLVWYLIAIATELIFPGFVSAVVNLDFLLIAVILLGSISLLISRKKV